MQVEKYDVLSTNRVEDSVLVFLITRDESSPKDVLRLFFAQDPSDLARVEVVVSAFEDTEQDAMSSNF